MAEFIPVPNVVQAEMRTQLDGQFCENGLYFRHAAPISEADMSDLATALEAWWKAGVMVWSSVDLTFHEVYITDLTTETSGTFSHPISPVTAGGINEESMSNNVAPCITFKTGGRGRSSRGRNYLSGISISKVTHNTIANDYLAGVTAAYLGLPGIVDEINWEWVIVSRYHNKEPRDPGISILVQSAAFTDNIVDSQRRRLPGRGR